MATTSISGVYYIDSLLAGASSRWNVGSSYGTSISLTYSFMTSPPADADSTESSTFQAFTYTQKTAARAALALWAEVANITLSEVSDSENVSIRFANDNQGGTSAGYAYYPTNGQVWLASDDTNSYQMTPGGYGFMTMIHEIGHALGLKHPGNYNAGGGGTAGPYLPTAEDNYQYSIMSYSDAANGLYDLMPALYDIAAIQYLYGANTSTRSGNSTYTFATTATVQTIWDGGGTDTLDASNQTLGASINLQAGSFSSIGALSSGALAANNVAIAYNVTIENAIGGSGNDTITGNAAANSINAGAGNDQITTGGGNDTIIGGAGNDTVTLSSGSIVTISGVETLTGSAGNDWVNLGDGGNTIILTGIETLAGGNGSDWITLGNRGNTIILAGIETLTGGANADFVTLGNRGNTMVMVNVETLSGGSGSDWITLGNRGNTIILAGIDTLTGGANADVITLGNRGNTMVMVNIDTLIGGANADVITLGNRGNTMVMVNIDTLIGGANADVITLGNRGNTLFVSGIETLTGGINTDVVTLEGGGNTMAISGIETLMGGSGADSITATGNGIRFRGGGGGDSLDLSGETGSDTVVFSAAGDGSVAGSIVGALSVNAFQSGTDKIVISDSLRTLVDHNGDGTVASALRAANTANLTADDLIDLAVPVSSLSDTDFSAFRLGLGAVISNNSVSSALVLAYDGTNTGLYLVANNTDTTIAADEVRMLARFDNIRIGVPDLSFG